MPTTPRDLLVRLLSGVHDTRADSALARLRSNLLRINVADVGELTFPIRAAQAKKLIAVARPAAFGHGEETLHDSSVRDTWELTPEQVELGGDEWAGQLDRVLKIFRDKLGLPAAAHVRAELHSMLIYGKGQFFLPHQDSEKHDEMVATLVVSLPSVHTGGELVIDDRGKERIYRSSHDQLTLVAFYADRRHEVRPVHSGYRISLTFNLLATMPTEPASSEPASRAANLLTKHFTTSVRRRYGDEDLEAPSRLAFLLDHEYSQRSLIAGRFKGADAQRVELLRAAAAQAGCECLFAQVDVHETHDAIPEAGWRNNWYDDEFDDEQGDEWDEDEEVVTPGDLIDEQISLCWWITPGASRGEKIELGLYDGEVCAATPSAALTPYESEYEGYMGNYGNTIDRWYHRAAVLVWPKEKAFANRARANPAWALRAVQRKLKNGDLDGARADALAKECWERTVRRLAQPTRAADDWSIAWSGCGCADCADFAKFLGSRTDRALRWPIAERRRQHIESHITSLGLPVSHTTERTGRPYSLLLTKTDELFTQDANERQEAETDLRWLVSTFGGLALGRPQVWVSIRTPPCHSTRRFSTRPAFATRSPGRGGP